MSRGKRSCPYPWITINKTTVPLKSRSRVPVLSCFSKEECRLERRVLQKVRECDESNRSLTNPWARSMQTLVLQCCALCQFHVIEGQNAHDQITSDRKSKLAWSDCILCIPFGLSWSPNECWLHTCTCSASVIEKWRLGLGAPLVACN